MRLELIRRKKSKNEKTNEKNSRPSIPSKRQRLRIKVSNFGKIQLQVEEIKSKEKIIDDNDNVDNEFSLEENLPKKKKSMKKKRQDEKSRLPDSRRRRR